MPPNSQKVDNGSSGEERRRKLSETYTDTTVTRSGENLNGLGESPRRRTKFYHHGHHWSGQPPSMGQKQWEMVGTALVPLTPPPPSHNPRLKDESIHVEEQVANFTLTRSTLLSQNLCPRDGITPERNNDCRTFPTTTTCDSPNSRRLLDNSGREIKTLRSGDTSRGEK
ncbi:unnamed protein product, partial [Allacma fusca]